MKKLAYCLLLPAILISTITLQAQTEKTLKKVLQLEGTRDGGANGAAVAWHPTLQQYYAVIAGNTDFFLGVYDAAGNLLSPSSQNALFDVRGLWYNPDSKTLQANGYNEFGWAEYKLDAKGFPTDISILRKGMNQPAEQSGGAYDPLKKVVYFFNDDGNVEKYSLSKGVYLETITLALGKTRSEGKGKNYKVIDDYNSTTVVYTGISGAELGLFNHLDKSIELYNIQDGSLTQRLSLPASAPEPEFLNFSYCNGIYWLFDQTNRIWKGYK